MYYIFDEQQQLYLDTGEKSIRECIDRLLSFHSIDVDYIHNIYELIDYGWSIRAANGTDITYKVFKIKKKIFNKLRNKYYDMSIL